MNIEYVIRCPTLPGKRRIDGRQILSKAKIALKECKKLLSLWNEFLKNGTPSGMDETDALKHVVQRSIEKNQKKMKIFLQ